MVPLLSPARYKAAYGGRGSGKSHGFAEMLIASHVADPDRSTVCVREVQKSLDKSVKKLLEQKIRALEVGDYFDIKSSEIRSRKGHGVILFQGMADHTAESIKSLEGFDCAWVEEAQAISQRSLDLLRPTIRKPGSELWFTWNPLDKNDPVDMLLRGPELPPDAVVVKVNYMQNPWFSASAMVGEMAYDRRASMEKYEHVWLGEYQKHAEARYFKNWVVEDFDTPKDAFFRFGADWGFSPDPTTLVRCYLEGRDLYLDYEAWQVGCEIEDTPNLFLTIPEAEKWPIIAGSDRPERIQSIRRAGFSKVLPAVRGPHSVEQGLEWLENFRIHIHSRCKHAQDEFRLFSHPVDPRTGAILAGYVDKNNHIIEALRYACEAVRRLEKKQRPANVTNLPVAQYWSGNTGAYRG